MPITMPPKAYRPLENQEDLLPYELSYIPENIRQKAQSELFEDEETRIHSLKLLRSMLKDEPDLHWQDDELHLLSFLRARKFDVKRAFNLAKTFYTVMGKRYELYYNFNYNDVKKTLEGNCIGFLPYRDSEGCAILLMNSTHWHTDVNISGDLMRCLTCGLLHANLSPATQICGFKVIIDCGGLTLSHIPHMTPTYVWLLAESLQNCFPARFRGVHIVNENVVFSYAWTLLKQVLTKKLRDRFHFHGKNVKNLHRYFSPSILPAEYEGKLPPYDNSEWAKKIEEKSEYFSHVLSFGYQKLRAKAEEKLSKQS